MALIDHLARRTLWLNVFLSSIVINAVLGIWALVVDDFGQTQGKVLATSFLVSATMVGILVNSAPVRERVLWPVPLLAIAASTIGFVLLIVAVWVEPDSDTWGRLMLSSLTIAGGGTLAGLLSLLGLQVRHDLVRQATVIAIGVLCVTIVVVLWAEPDSDWWARVIGIESVVVAALTLALPVISRFLPPDEATPLAVGSIRYCPACAAAVGSEPDVERAIDCGSCGLRFRVVVEDGAPTGDDEATVPGRHG